MGPRCCIYYIRNTLPICCIVCRNELYYLFYLTGNEMIELFLFSFTTGNYR